MEHTFQKSLRSLYSLSSLKYYRIKLTVTISIKTENLSNLSKTLSLIIFYAIYTKNQQVTSFN